MKEVLERLARKDPSSRLRFLEGFVRDHLFERKWIPLLYSLLSDEDEKVAAKAEELLATVSDPHKWPNEQGQVERKRSLKGFDLASCAMAAKALVKGRSGHRASPLALVWAYFLEKDKDARWPLALALRDIGPSFHDVALVLIESIRREVDPSRRKLEELNKRVPSMRESASS